MTIAGYSDRVNHALAFAAKHHDRQVRKGTRLPYLTGPANVGIILTRYGCPERVVVAGILRDVVEDCVGERYTHEMLEQRIGDKFGADVLNTLLSVTQRTVDDEGVEMSQPERREDCLDRLAQSSDEGRWVCAASNLHGVGTLLADLERTIDANTVWSRFAGGRDAAVRWYQSVVERLAAVGFAAPIMEELRVATDSLASR